MTTEHQPVWFDAEPAVVPVQFSQKHNPFLPRGAPCGDAFGGATFGSPLSSPPGSPSMAIRQVRAQDSAFLTPPGTPDLHASLNLSATSSASYADSPHAMPLMREGGALGLMKKAPLPSKTASPPGNVEEDDIAGILGALSLSSDAVHPASPEVLPPDAPHTDAVALFTPSGSPASCPYKVFSLSATSCIEDRLCATDWRFILSPLCLAYRHNPDNRDNCVFVKSNQSARQATQTLGRQCSGHRLLWTTRVFTTGSLWPPHPQAALPRAN